MIRPSLFLSAAVLVASASAQAPADIAEKIRVEGIEGSKAMAFLEDLTSNVGHRLTGSDNFTKACYWAMKHFEDMGLEVRLEKWDEWNLVWNRGAWEGRVVSPAAMDLWIATEAWTAGTDGWERGPLVVAPESIEAIDEMAKTLEGAYVWSKPRGEVGAALTERAEELGILGFVSAARGNRQYPNRIRVFGNNRVARGSWENRPMTPEIVVRADHAEALEELLGGDEPVVLEFNVENSFRKGPIELHNVVAELRGTEKPDEYVVVCGHLDSWHQAQGTTDNGTGATSTLEAARILTSVGAKPKRSIRFLLWGGEEQGLLGSQGYVQRHRTEMDKISCVFNHDTGTNWAQSLSVTPKMAEQFGPVFEPVMKLTAPDEDFEGPVFDLNEVESIRGGGGSDHASFLSAGVPGWSWGLKGRSDYFGYTWHTQWDTFDVAIEEYQRHTATVVALAALGTANMPELLDREGVQRRSGRGDAASFADGMFGAKMEGLTFKEVNADGVAAKAGFKAGDVLTKVNGKDMESLADMFGPLRDGAEALEFTVKRGEEEAKVTVKTADLTGGRRGRRRGGE